MWLDWLLKWWYSGKVVSAAASHWEGIGFKPQIGDGIILCRVYLLSPHVSVGFLWVVNKKVALHSLIDERQWITRGSSVYHQHCSFAPGLLQNLVSRPKILSPPFHWLLSGSHCSWHRYCIEFYNAQHFAFLLLFCAVVNMCHMAAINKDLYI